MEWLPQLPTPDDKVKNRCSFSGFYSKDKENMNVVSINQHLPILPESISSFATVRHCSKVIVAITNKLNPGQQPAIAADQPAYPLCKQILWLYPTEFGQIFWMLGALHIEMMHLCVIGDWLDDSGLKDIYEQSGLSTLGKINSFLKRALIKRSWYDYQVTLVALSKLSQDAFDKSNYNDYSEWKVSTMRSSENAFFWFHAVELEVNMFTFICSVREGNFNLFIRTLQNLLPYVFALDQTHYSRWLLIFIQDLQQLEEKDAVFSEFRKGHFTVNKTNCAFSSIEPDHAHKQNNKIIKRDGGAVGLFDNEDALMEWATCGPIKAAMLRDLFDDDLDEDENFCHHHENSDSFEKRFHSDRMKLIDAFRKEGNPFEEQPLINLFAKTVVPPDSMESTRTACVIGERQSMQLVDGHLIRKSVSLYDNIKLEKLPLFNQRIECKPHRTEWTVTLLKADCLLFANLYIACQSRAGDLENFFAHKNHAIPVSLSE